MYKVLLDGTLMCDSRIEELALSNPVVKLEEGKVGSFSFIIPPDHPMIDAVKRRKSIIEVVEDDEILFCGICIEVTEDFYKQKTVYCESELTYLNDTIQRPCRYAGMTVRELLEAYVSKHNSQANESKHFSVGMVTVEDSNDYISCYTNMESTMACIKADLVDDLGGFLQVRYENGIRYLDYLAESLNTNKQTIKLGKNLIDYISNIDSTDIATAIIPLGAKLAESSIEGLEERLTIKSVNDGLDYVFNQDAVNSYGWIYKTVTWDDVTTPEALKAKAEKYLAEVQFENVVIEAKALDLHFEDSSVEKFKLSDKIRVVSAPHGLNKYFRLTKLTRNLNNPEKDTITLGKDERLSLTAKTNKENVVIKQEIEKTSNSTKQQVIANATALIANAMGGFVVKTNDELLIMDTDNIETATKVWRWNMNGLGYSGNGHKGPFDKVAITMDGAIVADMITTGTFNANLIRAGILQSADGSNKWDLENGLFTMENGKIKIHGTVIKYASDYTQADVDRANDITIGLVSPTIEDFEKLDLNGDGVINIQDAVMIKRLVDGIDSQREISTSIEIDPLNAHGVLKTAGVFVGANGMFSKSVNMEKTYMKKVYVMNEGGSFSSGTNGTYTTADGKTVTVTNGIITLIS